MAMALDKELVVKLVRESAGVLASWATPLDRTLGIQNLEDTPEYRPCELV
jgi:hypothetical protein